MLLVVEELQTVFVEAEAILNSIRLTAISEVPNDGEAISPALFKLVHRYRHSLIKM